MKVLNDRRQPSDVILMRVCKCDDIKFLYAARPQIGRHGVFAGVGRSLRILAAITWRLTAAVDQHRAPSRRNDEQRIPLSDVENRQFEFALCECWSERVSCADKRGCEQCEGTYAHE